MTGIGSIAELWRYLVKSMQGERCHAVGVDARGIEGDRRFAFASADAPVGKPLLRSTQRAAMLRARASLQNGMVLVSPAEAEPLPVENHSLPPLIAGPEFTSTLSLLADEHPFTDVRPIALHSLATVRALSQALGGFDGRRLRSNIILALAHDEPFAEDQLAGRTIQLGPTVQLTLLERIPRCRMVSLDPETAAPDPSPLRWLAKHREGRAGIYARAVVAGTVSLGDEVTLIG